MYNIVVDGVVYSYSVEFSAAPEQLSPDTFSIVTDDSYGCRRGSKLGVLQVRETIARTTEPRLKSTTLFTTGCAGGRHKCLRPLQVDLWHFDLESVVRLTCDVGYLRTNFYPRNVVSGVLATATCLAGWVAGCPTHAGIVSKRLNISENFFHHLKAPSFWFLQTPAPIHNSKGNPFSRGIKYTGVGKIFVDFRRKSPFISETVLDRPMVTMEH